MEAADLLKAYRAITALPKQDQYFAIQPHAAKAMTAFKYGIKNPPQWLVCADWGIPYVKKES